MMEEKNIEVNIDGLIGPTHHFGGLGVGNLASFASQNQVSNPRQAALEGLAKMELLFDLGIEQFYLPPPSRPNWQWLDSLGFSGDRGDVLKRCFDEAPQVLSAAYSSSFMWTANAATVAPSSDTIDKKFHAVPANLCSNLHRGQEAAERRDQLRLMFSPMIVAQIHESLPSVIALRDEGAANHMRICSADGRRAIHIFVYGPSIDHRKTKFLPRQSELASRRVADTLRLRMEDCVFVEQKPMAIDAGVFHNDVIATSHGNLLVYHEHAFEDSEYVVETIKRKFMLKTGIPLISICILERELAIHEAVKSYLFNSQIVSMDDQAFELICPMQCFHSPIVASIVQQWIKDPSNPIVRVRYLDLDQSMRNGGGPACLRLRVNLTLSEQALVGSRFRIDRKRLDQIRTEVIGRYPDALAFSDLARLEVAENAESASKSIAELL